MYKTNGGNWLCVIKPNDVEVGLSFHQCRVLQPSFIWNRIRYQVMIAQTMLPPQENKSPSP